MRKKINYCNTRALIYICLLLIITSCTSTKEVTYFQDISLTDNSVSDNIAVYTEPTIQADDILSISIFTIDPVTSTPVNQLATQSVSANNNFQTSSPSINGFLVDKNGEIELSVIGKVKLSGLTSFQARDLIRSKASKVYKDPSVQVRFANFKVTVLGEVGRPATYTMPNEKVTVLDALGLAGDLTIFGKRENVLLIREGNGNKEFFRINLNSATLFSSPYFFLRQNDVLYVEPNKGKAASLNQARTQTYAVVGSVLSVLIVLLTRI